MPLRKMETAERRRTPRRTLHQSSTIVVRIDRQSDDDAPEWVGEGTLLNASLSGLACLMILEDQQMLEKGSVLKVDFQLPTDSAMFHMDARVISITPSDTPNHYFVGLELVENEKRRSRLKDLSAALTFIG